MSQDEGNALLSGTGTGGASIQTPYQQQQQQQQQHYGGGGDDDSQPLISSVSRQGDESEDTIEELDPHHVGTKMTSFTETLINFLKGNICAGFLSLPFAFAQGGYVGGTALLAFIASICVHCMLLLVKTKQHVCAENKITRLSYGQLAEHAIGRAGIMIVNAALLVTQFGFVCVYVVFIAQHIQEFSDRFSYQVYALLISPAVVLLTWIKDFKTIAPTSVLANICIIYSCAVIFAYIFQHIGSAVPADPDCPLHYDHDSGAARCLAAAKPVPWAGFASLPIFFGNAVFAFESIGLVIPMENTIRDKSKFPLVVMIGMSIVVSLYILFALTGYLTFGDSVQGSITLNLPSNALFGSVKIALALAFLQSFIVQFLPAIDVIEETTQPIVNARVSSAHVRAAFQNGIRSLIVAALVALSIAIPHLGLIISLIGSLGCGMLALTLPALMHMFALRPLPWSHLAVDLFIVIFGIVGSVAGVFVSIQQLIAAS